MLLSAVSHSPWPRDRCVREVCTVPELRARLGVRTARFLTEGRRGGAGNTMPGCGHWSSSWWVSRAPRPAPPFSAPVGAPWLSALLPMESEIGGCAIGGCAERALPTPLSPNPCTSPPPGSGSWKRGKWVLQKVLPASEALGDRAKDGKDLSDRHSWVARQDAVASGRATQAQSRPVCVVRETAGHVCCLELNQRF